MGLDNEGHLPQQVRATQAMTAVRVGGEEAQQSWITTPP